MALSDEQVERYSRQIILPGFGGKAQERILDSKILAIGGMKDLESPLRYLAGAGIGRISVVATASGQAETQTLRLRDLNPEVKFESVATVSAAGEIMFIAIGNEAAVNLARIHLAERPRTDAIVVRLDEPPTVAILKVEGPCALCADPNLLAPFRTKTEIADFSLMVASAECLKIAAGLQEATSTVITIRGLETSTAVAEARPGCPVCGTTHRVDG